MRLLRIDLRSYAHFSNYFIHLERNKNIHVLYGENEAGKSSFARALKALIFGIEKNTQDAFLHSFDHLFIEGTLENQVGKYIQVIRDGSAYRKLQPLAMESLCSLDKKTLLNLFFLNQESIYIGSKDLIENIKHFDVSLFTSIQGAQEVISVLKKIELDIENLYKYRGTKPLINQKISKIQELLNQKKSLHISGEQFYELEKELCELQKSQSQLYSQLQVEIQKYDELKLLYEVYFELKRLKEINIKLSLLENKKILDQRFLEKYTPLFNLQNEKRKQINFVKKEIAELDFEISKITYDEKFLKRKNEILDLISDHGRVLECMHKVEEINKDLHNLKFKYKKLNLDLQNQIKTSISESSWKRLKTQLTQVSENLKVKSKLSKNLEAQIQSYQLQLQENEKNDCAVALKRKLENVKQLLWIAQNKFDQKANYFALQEKINVTLKKYEHSKIFNLELSRIVLTKNEKLNEQLINKSINKYYFLHSKYLNSKNLLKSLQDQINDLVAKKQFLAINLDDYFAQKASKNQTIKELIKPWGPQNYLDKYEKFKYLACLIANEDEIEEQLFNNPKLLIYLSEKDQLETKYQIEVKINEKYIKSLESWNQQFEKLTKKMLCPFDFLNEKATAEVFKYILEYNQLVDLLNVETELGSFIFTINELLQIDCCNIYISDIIEKLKKYYNELSIQIDRTEKINQKVHFYKEAIDSLIEQQKEELDDHKLKSLWQNVHKQCDIQILFCEKTIDLFVEKMDQFFEFSKEIKLKNETLILSHKIIDSFKNNWIKTLGFTYENPDNIQWIKKQIDENEQAKFEFEKRSFLKQKKIESSESLEQETLINDEEIQKLLVQFNLKLHQISSEEIENAQSFYLLKSESEKIENNLRLRGHLKEWAALFESIENHKNIESISLLLKSSELNLTLLREKISNLDKQIGANKYQQTLIFDFKLKHDIESKLQTEIYDLNQLIKSYLVAKTAAKYIRSKMWDFQKNNQQNILGLAAIYFDQLTDGKYTQLNLNLLDDQHSYLECLSSSKNLLKINQLSEGTRDQLFLALKLAFLEIYSEKNEPLPLILDDILVNFDDKRTTQCIEILQKFSKNIQIIFLTHHKHLLDLFQKTLPNDEVEYLNLEQVEVTSYSKLS